jgi:adenosylhomocysteine nucleosidase
VGTGPIPEPVTAKPAVGLVAALPVELRCLTSLTIQRNIPLLCGKQLVCVVSGMGATNAKLAVEKLVSLGFKPQALISWGTAGAIQTGLQAGDLLIPHIVRTSDGTQLKTCTAARDTLRELLQANAVTVHDGSLLEVKDVISTVADKQVLARNTDTVAVDMESAELGRIAETRGIPFLVIRTIVDAADQSIPEVVIRTIDECGNVRIFSIAKELFFKPALVMTLFQLSRAMHMACKTLEMVANKTDKLSQVTDIMLANTSRG